MVEVALQFHALPRELAPIIVDVLEERDLRAIAVEYHPFAAHVVSRDQIEREVAEGSADRLLLVAQPPAAPIDTPSELNEAVPDAVVLNIGREGPEGLAETFLSCRTDDDTLGVACRTVAKRVRTITRAGVRGVAPTGESAWYRNHRYTQGAAGLYAEGVALLPVAGNTRYEIDGDQ